MIVIYLYLLYFFFFLKGEEGFYVLCDGSKLRDPKDKCKLSKTVDVNALSNFKFWYFMWG
jgi:hypothetical protein